MPAPSFRLVSARPSPDRSVRPEVTLAATTSNEAKLSKKGHSVQKNQSTVGKRGFVLTPNECRSNNVGSSMVTREVRKTKSFAPTEKKASVILCTAEKDLVEISS